MVNKKAFEFSFSWIFAIIVGAVVIFLGIYTAMRIISTGQLAQDTELGKQLGIILTPIETSLEAGKISTISMPSETRIYNDCSSNQGNFGIQRISVATLNLNKEWSPKGLPSSFSNKYLFSPGVSEGKNFIVFSKQLIMPFKIADLIYLWSKDEVYCFINAPNEISEEINDLGLNINLTSSASQCPKISKKVCFTSSGCDIDVSLDSAGYLRGSVKRKFSERVYFESSALFYGAVFSDSQNYECQLKRLTKRASEISSLYLAKTIMLSAKGCRSNLESELNLYSEKALSLNNSLDLREITASSENLRRRNNDLSCRLF